MVKTAIIGAQSPEAGELIRILINHPEVELLAISDPDMAGRNVADVHHGLIGETEQRITAGLPEAARCDVVFITAVNPIAEALLGEIDKFPNLKIIDLTGHAAMALPEPESVIYGVPEINRKPLVRGAKYAVIPSALETAALVGLFPPALNLLLGDALQMTVTTATPPSDDALKAQKENIRTALHTIQQSFDYDIPTTVLQKPGQGLNVTLHIPTAMSMEEILKVYDSVYDDHNFTFFTLSNAGMNDVLGTNKVILRLSKPSAELLEIATYVDPCMRGGAGQAVHVMNLLEGLHEKVGLTFKTNTGLK